MQGTGDYAAIIRRWGNGDWPGKRELNHGPDHITSQRIAAFHATDARSVSRDDRGFMWRDKRAIPPISSKDLGGSSTEGGCKSIHVGA